MLWGDLYQRSGRTQLREAVDHVLGVSSFKKVVATIRDAFRTLGGSHQAVDEIFKFKSQYDLHRFESGF